MLKKKSRVKNLNYFFLFKNFFNIKYSKMKNNKQVKRLRLFNLQYYLHKGGLNLWDWLNSDLQEKIINLKISIEIVDKSIFNEIYFSKIFLKTRRFKTSKNNYHYTNLNNSLIPTINYNNIILKPIVITYYHYENSFL